MNFKWDLKKLFKEKKQQQTTNRKRSMDSIARRVTKNPSMNNYI